MFKPAHSVGGAISKLHTLCFFSSSFSCFLPSADLPLCIRAVAKSACCSAGCARASCASAPPVRGTRTGRLAPVSSKALVHAELLSRSNLLPSSGRCEYENCVSSLNAKYRGYSPCVPCIGRWHPPSFPSLLLPPRTVFYFILFFPCTVSPNGRR